MRIAFVLSLFITSVLLISCEKSIEEPLFEKDTNRINRNSSEKRLSYGDAVFYLGNTPRENRVDPVSKPDIEGKYVAIPGGLSLNQKTGQINLSKSLTGQAYKIFYVTNDNRLVDSARIVISGIDYEDGIYSLSKKNGKFGKNADAYYKAESINTMHGSFLNSFETTGINEKNVVLNPRNGSIDLEASLEAGILGHKKPREGSNVEFSIEYKIAGQSKRVKNKTEVLIYYFDTEGEIPAEIKKTLAMREYIKNRVDAMPPPGWTSTEDPGIGNPIEEDLVAYKVRPPLIIIYGQ